ncbi:hypothetical protein TCON_2093 [Astathelohania contejeani]|uniref:Uncharacterized protein n=1 Tax=Astathelohania contejeani TaxID=164912 RepID=A0ABQ7HX33_9MICR|nr:hypothetical protein TCON_2093 [Thelohania contejeani]
MEKIKFLYNDCKQIEDLLIISSELELQIDNIHSQITSYKSQIMPLDTLYYELEDIENEIEEISIIIEPIRNTRDIKRVIKYAPEMLNDKLSKYLDDIIRTEDKKIIISKKLEVILSEIEEEKIKNIVKTKLSDTFKDEMFHENCDISKLEIKETENEYVFGIGTEMFKPAIISKEIKVCLLSIFKQIYKKQILYQNFNLDKLKQIGWIFFDSEYNINEHILDILLKGIAKISKEYKFEIELNIHSHEYLSFIELIERTKDIETKRKDKLNTKILRYIFKFFDIRNTKPTVQNYLILFSDLSDLIKHNRFIKERIREMNEDEAFKIKEKLNDLKDMIFFECIKQSLIKEWNWMKIITDLRNTEVYFTGLLDYILPSNMALSFKISHYQALIELFIEKICLINMKYDISMLEEIALFIMNDIIKDSGSMVSNINRLESIIKLLESNDLNSILEYWINDLIFLDKKELIALIKVLFGDSKETKRIINRL